MGVDKVKVERYTCTVMEKKSHQQHAQQPNTKYPTPPFPEQKQEYPGKEALMKPLADHGEKSYKSTGKLADRKVILTGGDSGIGKALAIAIARDGADIGLCVLDDLEDDTAKDTRKYVEEAGGKCILVKGYITSEAHCKSIVRKAVEAFGRIDILVNNAAFHMARESLQDIPSDEWTRTFDVNVHSIFYLCKAAEPHMQPGSSIINTTSVNTFSPSDDLLPYAATKAAVKNFTANLSQILLKKGKGIRVNDHAPEPARKNAG